MNNPRRNNPNNNNNNNDDGDGASPWLIAAGVGVAGALLGGAAYWLSGSSENKPVEKEKQKMVKKEPVPRSLPSSSNASTSDQSVSSYLSDLLSRMDTSRGGSYSSGVTIEEIPNIPENPVISNLNSLLSDIYVRYIKLTEFNLHYKVFDTIFQDLHKKMKEVDPYYKKYSSTVQFAGSHYDNLRIVKPDEFDMDIVIGLPLNIKTDAMNPQGSDIIIDAKAPGFVELRMGVQFQRLPFRDADEWLVNKAAFEWKDDCNFLLRSKFSDWFKSVVSKALNKFEINGNSRPVYYVEGVPYIIDRSESGPAMTLLISNKSRNFKLDVDLVPCLKFPEDRWPISKAYREIPPECKKDYWMVVGKPNKASPSAFDQARSWRIALHNQERQLMYNSNNMRQAIRFIKKLRDSQGMKAIASYYIKTLFFWEIVAVNDRSYWNKNNPATLFKVMVRRLYEALALTPEKTLEKAPVPELVPELAPELALSVVLLAPPVAVLALAAVLLAPPAVVLAPPVVALAPSVVVLALQLAPEVAPPAVVLALLPAPPVAVLAPSAVVLALPPVPLAPVPHLPLSPAPKLALWAVPLAQSAVVLVLPAVPLAPLAECYPYWLGWSSASVSL
ncbi:hypothetical protein PYW07_015089 [Mythimna separata]|uniref:Cyclic GMP-AMP synthase n=1 Tax=Mythimna separata TaxID=271217 RepID=A0AAD7YWP5_MYTSE|nr:hypothetical protein PYW07_015089 [Mythimna separata]